MKRSVTVLFGVLLMAVTVRAQPLQTIFDRATSAASQGAYDEAVRGYALLINAGVHDADVHYNLGTVWAQQGDLPRAIWQYEKALRLRPSDAEAAIDLDKARRTLALQRTETEGQAVMRPASSPAEALFRKWSEDTLARVLLISNVLLFMVLAWLASRRSRGGSTWPGIVLAAAFGALLLASAAGLAVKSGVLRDGDTAILLTDRVELREGPDPRARVRITARGGDRAEILDREGNFVHVVVPGVGRGWTEYGHIGAI